MKGIGDWGLGIGEVWGVWEQRGERFLLHPPTLPACPMPSPQSLIPSPHSLRPVKKVRN
ncbi:hypothetical protein H6G98_20490 [Nostoc sp. FACHB-857]|nr:hypothetical protein [Nostoc sp. FACHB-857]